MKIVEPDYVAVQVYFEPAEARQYCISMRMKTEDVKKLNLMVNDTLTLRLIKESQK